MSDLSLWSEPEIGEKIDKIQASKDLNKILLDVCTAYFGIYPSVIQPIVIEKAIKEILKNFKHLTLAEITHSFERIEIQKSITITVDELMKPIRKYSFVKHDIKVEKWKFQKELQEKELIKDRVESFKLECISIYEASLKKKEWLGTVFHAFVLAKEFLANNFERKEKAQMFLDAGTIKEGIMKDCDVKNYYQHIGKTVERIYAEIIVKKSIELNLKLK